MTEYQALREALRRYVCFHMDESLTEAWTGLGFKTDYRVVLEKSLMEWVHGKPPPCCMGWLRLTARGAEIVQGWLEEEGYDES